MAFPISSLLSREVFFFSFFFTWMSRWWCLAWVTQLVLSLNKMQGLTAHKRVWGELGKVWKCGWVSRPLCKTASTLCFCCSTGAIHIQPNGGVLLAHTCTHSCCSQASAWWPPINKKRSHSQRQWGRDLKIRRTNLIVVSARATGPGLEGGKGKWRAKERERDCVCLREISCGCPFADLIYSEGEKCVLWVWSAQLDCTIPLALFSSIHMLKYCTC